MTIRANAPAPQNPLARIRELDGWRAVSILLVLLHHLFFFQHPQFAQRFPPLRHFFAYAGPQGVRTFFVISGFVICRLLISEQQRYGSVSLKGFYTRRVFRILPPFYLYLTTIAILTLTGALHESRHAIAASAAFLYDLRSLQVNWLVGHTWSLAVEEQFYLIFPVLWIITPQRRRGPLFTCVFLLCVAWTLSWALPRGDGVVTEQARAGFSCISCGILMAIYEQRARNLAARVHPAVVTLVALILLDHPVPADTTFERLFDSLFVPLGLGLVILYSLERASWLKAVLCSRPVQAVGLTSYGIYLWQQLFTMPAIDFPAQPTFTRFLLPLLAITVPISYFFVEKPAMRIGKALSTKLRQKNPSTPDPSLTKAASRPRPTAGSSAVSDHPSVSQIFSPQPESFPPVPSAAPADSPR
jgi:peptidoglycan/LPS O-acetylase OafA/YrhL